ncbi:MAG: hypothetical protein AAF630_03190 [Cyanobacteria bacterium P01_C01_bin.38]
MCPTGHASCSLAVSEQDARTTNHMFFIWKGASQFCTIKILVVIANEVKQSQSVAIASLRSQ